VNGRQSSKSGELRQGWAVLLHLITGKKRRRGEPASAGRERGNRGEWGDRLPVVENGGQGWGGGYWTGGKA
jgi:hypothetical protein